MYSQLISIVGTDPIDNPVGFAITCFIFCFTFLEFFSVLFSSFATWFKK